VDGAPTSESDGQVGWSRAAQEAAEAQNPPAKPSRTDRGWPISGVVALVLVILALIGVIALILTLLFPPPGLLSD